MYCEVVDEEYIHVQNHQQNFILQYKFILSVEAWLHLN